MASNQTRKEAQIDFLKKLAINEFERQGFRGGIDKQAQIDTAARIAHKAIAATFASPSEAIVKAVEYVRVAQMRVAPVARTVALCNCGKPKTPHSSDLHN